MMSSEEQPEVEEDYFAELAAFIKREVPYGSDVVEMADLEHLGSPVSTACPIELTPPVNAMHQTPQIVEVDGIFKDNDAAHPTNRRTMDLLPGEDLECLFWFFKGDQHRITKAMRIPFIYNRTRLDGNGHEFKEPSLAYFMVGIEGPGDP